ncbi:MAG: type II toxin-antitoxin system VapC family toxin [Thainema sp.]
MKLLFADTFFWIAFLNPADDWHHQVRQTFARLQPCQLITTDEVLTEVLAFYSKSGVQLRTKAANLVRDILASPDVDVYPQSHQSFLDGLTLYEQRLDKGYSLADCISMNVMKRQNIAEILTHDKH